MSIELAQYKGPKVAQIIDAVIVAGGNKVIEGIGDVFRVVSSDGQLTIRSNLTPKAIFTTKQGLRADDSNLFERLEIYNETGADITLRLFYGFGDFLDGSNQILGSVSITGGVITVTASALPAGAATEAKQDAGIVELTALVAAMVLPAALDGAGRLKIGRNAIGAQNNAWNATVVGIGGTSNSVDTLDCPNVSAFGHVSAATTVTVQVSEDNVTFFDTATNVVLAGVADFHISISTGAKYARLKSSAAATISATIAAK